MRADALRRRVAGEVDARLGALLGMSHACTPIPRPRGTRSGPRPGSAELADAGFDVQTGACELPTAFIAGRHRPAAHRDLRRVRRAARGRPRLRPQHHRRVLGRGRAGPGRRGRRPGPHRDRARHPGRRGRRGQGLHAGAGRLRRDPRGDDGPPGPGRRGRGAPVRGVAHAGPLPRQGDPRRGLPRAGHQRGRRLHRGPGGHRPAAPAAAAQHPRARGGDPRRRRPQHHPRADRGPLVRPGREPGRAGRAGTQDPALLRGGRAGHRLRARDRGRGRPRTPSSATTRSCSRCTAPTPSTWAGSSCRPTVRGAPRAWRAG